MSLQPTKNQAYDAAVYQATRYRQAAAVSGAGSGGTFGRYVARGDEQLLSVGAYQVVAGTSTYTTTDTVGGVVSTNTTTAATLVTPFRVSGTSTTTGATFPVGAGKLHNWSSFGTGGVSLLAGDIVYLTNGTDATATSIPELEFGYANQANIAA